MNTNLFCYRNSTRESTREQEELKEFYWLTSWLFLQFRVIFLQSTNNSNIIKIAINMILDDEEENLWQKCAKYLTNECKNKLELCSQVVILVSHKHFGTTKQ